MGEPAPLQPTASNETSLLLRLPLEVRLNILERSCRLPETATLSAGFSPGAGGEIKGLGADWVPVVSRGYDADLLGAGVRDANMLREKETMKAAEPLSHPAALTTMGALSLTCRQLNEEVKNCVFFGQQPQWLNLHLTYPYGVCALMQYWPNLLTRAVSVKISASFDVRAFTPDRVRVTYMDQGREVSRNIRAMTCDPDMYEQQCVRQNALLRLVTFLTGRRAACALEAAIKGRLPAVDFAVDDLAEYMCEHEAILRRQVAAAAIEMERSMPWIRSVLPLEDLVLRVYYPREVYNALDELNKNAGPNPLPRLMDQYERILQTPVDFPEVRDISSVDIQGNDLVYTGLFNSALSPSMSSFQTIQGGFIDHSISRGKHGHGSQINAIITGKSINSTLRMRWPAMTRDDPMWAIGEEWPADAQRIEGTDYGDARKAIVERFIAEEVEAAAAAQETEAAQEAEVDEAADAVAIQAANVAAIEANAEATAVIEAPDPLPVAPPAAFPNDMTADEAFAHSMLVHEVPVGNATGNFFGGPVDDP